MKVLRKLWPILLAVGLLAVLVLTIHGQLLLQNQNAAEEDALRKRLEAAAVSVSMLVSGDELARFQSAEDMARPDYLALKAKLADYARTLGVKYAYYQRIQEGKAQYVVDNDYDPRTQTGLNSEPQDLSEITGGFLEALSGTPSSSRIGEYEHDWQGLLTAYAPVYAADGRIVAAAGVDIEDAPIRQARERARWLSVAIVFAFGSLLLGIGFGLLTRFQQSRAAKDARDTRNRFMLDMSDYIRRFSTDILHVSGRAQRDYGSPRGLAALIHLRTLGERLLEPARCARYAVEVDTDQIELRLAAYETASLLQDSLAAAMPPMSEDWPLPFCADIADDIPARMIGDEMRLRYILIRLLSPPAAQLLGCTAKVRKLSETEVELAFGVTWRLGEHAREVALPVSRGLCRAMGGDLTIEAHGHERHLMATLIQTVDDWQPAGLPSRPPTSPVPPPAPEPFLLPDTALLAIDDAPINLAALSGMLVVCGGQTFTADGGEEALAFLEKRPVDLIFLDLTMPQMDGLETIARLRQLENGKHVPVIAMTAGSAAPGLREKLLQSSFDDFLAKPVDRSRLEYLLKKWLPKEKRQPASETEPAAAESD